MLNCVHPESPSDSAQRGVTLVELLVVLAIISILAVTAIPFAENGAQRRREFELRENLRTLRTAIDAFHADWKDGDIAQNDAAASEDGYPVTLQVLVDGVSGSSADVAFLRYLRRIPRNPFVARAVDPDEQWLYIGYRDALDAARWNGLDVYDLRAKTEKLALDGSRIADW